MCAVLNSVFRTAPAGAYRNPRQHNEHRVIAHRIDQSVVVNEAFADGIIAQLGNDSPGIGEGIEIAYAIEQFPDNATGRNR